MPPNEVVLDEGGAITLGSGVKKWPPSTVRSDQASEVTRKKHLPKTEYGTDVYLKIYIKYDNVTNTFN